MMQLAAGVTSRETMEALLGSFVHPFAHNRLCMSIWQRSYKWVHSLPERRLVRLPWLVRQEIFMAGLHLAIAVTDIRSPISTRIHFSDATPSTGGFVGATVSRKLAESLHDVCEFRGRHARLDWDELDFALAGWEDFVPDAELLEALRGLQWDSSGQIRYKRIEHVNIQEARAVKSVLKARASGPHRSERVICGVDSRVVLGAWTKGRSSSVWPNRILQQAFGWCMLGGKRMLLLWVPSELNSGHDPSGDREVRRPEVVSDAAVLESDPQGPGRAAVLESHARRSVH